MKTEKRKILINPKGTEAIYANMQFSQAVRSGDTVWVSGQVGIDNKWKVAEGVEEQARLAFQNLQHVIQEAEGSLDDVVELTIFLTSMAGYGDFSKVKSEFFPNDYPALTALGVTELVLPNLLLEIRATAVIGSGQGMKND